MAEEVVNKNQIAFNIKLNEQARKRKELIKGKTSMNMLMASLNKMQAREYTGTYELEDYEGYPNTLKKFVQQLIEIRCLTGQNANSMISEEDVKKQGLTLASWAQPYYDMDNNKFYDLSMIANGNPKMQYEYAKLCSPTVKESLTNGIEQDKVVSICQDLEFATGVKLVLNDKGLNRFLSSKQPKKMLFGKNGFVKQNGNLYVDTKGKTTTNILTTYINYCIAQSVKIDFKSISQSLSKDRDFLMLSFDDKQIRIDAIRKRFVETDLQNELQSICTDLVASEMVKTLPLLSAQERLTMSQAYLLSATQRINALGNVSNNKWLMKFVAENVTESLNKFNKEYGITPQEIMKINKSFNQKPIFEETSIGHSVYGKYELPYAGAFNLSTTEFKDKDLEIEM